MVMLAAWMSLPVCAEVRSGKAAAEWISTSATCIPGKALQTAIRLVVDDGWHTYWLNPGEAGMKTRVEWKLPAGWTATGLAHPVPERFRAGGLAGFGYTGTVVFPVTVTPPPDFSGRAQLKAGLSWLTCDDAACVPGDVELTLALESGPPAPTAEAETIRNTLQLIPRPQPEWLRLNVTEKKNTLALTIDTDGTRSLDFSRGEGFPATRNVIDPAADIHFTRNGAQWATEVPKSEYVQSPLKQLTLVLAGMTAEAPVELRWKSP